MPCTAGADRHLDLQAAVSPEASLLARALLGREAGEHAPGGALMGRSGSGCDIPSPSSGEQLGACEQDARLPLSLRAQLR